MWISEYPKWIIFILKLREHVSKKRENHNHNTNWRFVRKKLKYYFTRLQSYFIHESPRRNISSFRTNGMQAYIIQYTIIMMIHCYIFYNVSYLSPSISTSVLMTQPACTMDRRSGWSPPAVGSRCHESCQILASLCPLIWHNTCWHGFYN